MNILLNSYSPTFFCYLLLKDDAHNAICDLQVHGHVHSEDHKKDTQQNLDDSER